MKTILKLAKTSAYSVSKILKLSEYNQNLQKLSEHNQKAVLKLAKESVYSVSEILDIIDMCAKK